MVRYFRHFNVVIPRCLVNLMTGTTLQRRDCALKSVDPRITEQERVALRSASLLNDRLFDGQAKPVVTRLKDSAQDFSLQKSIKAMAAATQQLANSTPAQQKPPFQGVGTAQVPKTRKHSSRGSKSSKPASRGSQTKQHQTAQSKQGTVPSMGSQGTKPPSRETLSAKRNLFKGGFHK